MHRFEYRTPRFPVDFPLQFTVDNVVLSGRCMEISEEGLAMRFRQPATLDALGVLALTHQGQTLEIRARVAHIEGTHAGLEFLCNSESERSAVARLTAALAESQSRPGPVLLR
jgi:hypothetical protein